MRHRKHGRKLSCTSAHRKAMGANMIRNLVAQFGKEREYLITSVAKAKEFRPLAERLVTMAKEGTLAARRRLFSVVADKEVVTRMFKEIGPRYQQRPGGYIRILKLATRCLGDGSPRAMLAWVPATGEKKVKTKKA